MHRGFIPRDLSNVARLLAEVFGPSGGAGGGDADDDEEGEGLSAAQLATYQLRLMAALQMRAATEGKDMTTLVAYTATPPGGSPPAGSPRLAGSATVAPGLGPADAQGHDVPLLREGETVASISNMAVDPRWRRRGLGGALLAAAEAAAARWATPPAVLALSVYRSNAAAVRLYERAGYAVDATWMDQRWLRSAERGQVGFQRRQLMLKHVKR